MILQLIWLVAASSLRQYNMCRHMPIWLQFELPLFHHIVLHSIMLQMKGIVLLMVDCMQGNDEGGCPSTLSRYMSPVTIMHQPT